MRDFLFKITLLIGEVAYAFNTHIPDPCDIGRAAPVSPIGSIRLYQNHAISA